MKGTMTDTFLVSFTHTPPNKPLLIIGRKQPKNDVSIINAYNGEEAVKLYDILTGSKGIPS